MCPAWGLPWLSKGALSVWRCPVCLGVPCLSEDSLPFWGFSAFPSLSLSRCPVCLRVSCLYVAVCLGVICLFVAVLSVWGCPLYLGWRAYHSCCNLRWQMAAHVFSGVNTVQAFILLHVGPYLEGQLELAVAVSRETTDANRKAWGITLQRFVRKRRIMKERK